MKVMAVTGFVPNAFPAKHLTKTQCRVLGEKLTQALDGQIVAYDEGWKLRDCWANTLRNLFPPTIPATREPPSDRFAAPQDMVASNVVLLQRYEWMRIAADEYPDVDAFAWIEYTIFKQKGITAEVLQDFMAKVAASGYDAISLPGCWPKTPIDDSIAHWRFVGSAWVCPKKYVAPLADAIREVVTLRTHMTYKLSMDMNSMAYVELLDILPIRWYAANHDETQFTNF